MINTNRPKTEIRHLIRKCLQWSAGLLAVLLLTTATSAVAGDKAQGTSGEFTPKYTDAFDMRYGLFIHWVGCSPTQRSLLRYPDGTPALPGGIDKYADSHDVEKVADEMAALGFEYVLITDFHGFGTMLHPSPVSDKWRGKGYASKRDLIGEMIVALKKRGIGFVLFTHPVAGHTYPKKDQDKLGWNDPTDNYKKWNDFINEMYAELAERYGNEMMGMGFDSEFGLSGNKQFTGKLDLKRLRKTILSKAPNLQLYALAAPNETCEFGHREVWRGTWHSPWQFWRKKKEEDSYEVEEWPSYLKKVSVVLPAHWATIKAADQGMTHLNAEQVYRYTVLQAGVATEGPGSAWAASPYPDGSWEKGVREVFADTAKYMGPVRKSLTRVYPSTSYPTTEGTSLSKLSHGVVATKATDDTVEYIHVLNPPKGKALKLPAPKDGKKFSAAKLLKTGNRVKMTQNIDGVELVIGKDDNWDKLNTVIALKVDSTTLPRRNLALHQKVTASDGFYTNKLPPKNKYGRIRLVDGQRRVTQPPHQWSSGNFGWSSEPRKTMESNWVQVDLSKLCDVSEVCLYPRDDKENEGEGFPIDIEVQLSKDGKEWKTVANKKGMPRSKEAQTVKFNKTKAHYVRIVGTKLRQQKDKLYSMQITEIEVY